MNLLSLIKKPSETLRPICLFHRVEIHLSTFLLFGFALFFRFAHLLALTYLIALIHELAHIATAKYLNVKVDKVELLPFGVTMKLHTQTIKSPKDEIKIALAGPVSNVVFAVISLYLFRLHMISLDTARFLITANCGIALINLVPALPLDGGRMLRAYLTIQWGYVKAFNFILLLTRILSVVLLVLGAFALVLTGFNFSLLLISCFLLVNAVFEQRGSKLVMMREILYSREKLAQSGIGHAGTLVMMAQSNARAALKLLSYNKYYLIRIIDEEMKPIATITETQLIEGLIEKGMRGKAIEIIN
jgi:stage IV sporulation protein FB